MKSATGGTLGDEGFEVVTLGNGAALLGGGSRDRENNGSEDLRGLEATGVTSPFLGTLVCWEECLIY